MDMANVTIADTASHVLAFDWPWPILNIWVKFMHILTANISQTVADKANITIAIT